MKPIGQEYQELLHTIFSLETANYVLSAERSQSIGKPHVDMFSSTTGQLVNTDTVCSAWYWRTNLESPVLFSDSLEKLLLSQLYHMIEIGPHPTLGQPIWETQKNLQIEEEKIKYSPILSRDKNAEITMLDLAGNLYLCGHKIPFDKDCFHIDQRSRPLSAFNEERRANRHHSFRTATEPRVTSAMCEDTGEVCRNQC